MGVISIEKLTYTYPGTSTPALREINLEMQAGSFTGIVGPNGAGKSTLCYAIAGYVPHFFRGTFEGVVEVAGNDSNTTPLNRLVLSVGLVFQNPFNQISGSKFTVFEEVAFGLENLGVPRSEMTSRIQYALELTGIADLADRSPFALSGGQQQRLALASILVMEPDVLVLDEPTSQLDPIGTRQMFDVIHTLSEQGVTIVMAEHKLEGIAEFADRVVLLNEGRVAMDGSAIGILNSPDLINYGISPTRYTLAALAAREQGLWPPDQLLPITLEQAVRGFRRVIDAG